MPITDHKNYPFSFSMIDIKKIDPSPYQHRKYFDVEMGKEPEYLTVGKTWLEQSTDTSRAGLFSVSAYNSTKRLKKKIMLCK